MRSACFLRIPWSTFFLYTEHLGSILEGNSWYVYPFPAVRGGCYGASGSHLCTPGSQPDGALHRDRGAPGDLSRLARGRPRGHRLTGYVQREFDDYLRCGILAHGFLRLGCDTCKHELLVPFSCKRRGFCPSCAGRRMAQMAAHLVEQVIPWVPTRQWVVSVPVPLRYWMAGSQDLTATVHTIIRTTIGQYYVNQAVQRGHERATAHPGSVTFIQRFGSALQLHVHYHVLFLEGVFLDRTDQGRPPRFLPGEPPTNTDIAAVIQKISRRVIRKLRRLGYLEADMEPPVATEYDPLRDSAPELARTS